MAIKPAVVAQKIELGRQQRYLLIQQIRSAQDELGEC